MPIYLHIVWDCFHIIVAELNSCEKDRGPAYPKNFTISPFISNVHWPQAQTNHEPLLGVDHFED